jgi:DNA-directed RNA polymerase subunit M/transcription elongation factor TFIIS
MIPCPGCKATLRIRDEFAGRSMKCPRCSAPLSIPAADKAGEKEPVVAALVEEEEQVIEGDLVEDQSPQRRKGKPQARGQDRTEDRIKCPECGKRVPADAERCRHCKAWLEEREEDKEEGEWVDCPQCGEPGPRVVNWTWWGSYFGPKLGNQVRCVECGHTYNGLSGGSNIGLKIVFIALPLILILGVLVGLFFWLKSKGIFD